MFERGDIQDRARLDQVMERYRPEAVMHFAAYAYVGESVTDPGKYYRNNVAGTLTLLEAMRDQGIERLIFSSTCATYGIPQRVPISRPSSVEKPIDVATDSPSRIAHRLAPLPSCATRRKRTPRSWRPPSTT